MELGDLIKYKKWFLISLMVFAWIACAILWFVNPFGRKFTLVEFDSLSLKVNGKVVSPVIRNAKDGYPDFPDSAYHSGTLLVTPFRESILQFNSDSALPLKLKIVDTFPYATWKPLLVTAKKSGFDSVLIGCSDSRLGVFHFNNHQSLKMQKKEWNCYPEKAILMSYDYVG